MGEVWRREFAWLDAQNRRIEKLHRERAAASAWGGLAGLLLGVAALAAVFLGRVPV